jgi:iron-regulated transporter 1
MLSAGYSAIAVSLLRVAAVVSELLATCFGPVLMTKIGPVRSGLWSINWQVIWLALSVAAYVRFESRPMVAGAGLTVGIVISRIGLFGFDLSVQHIVQEVSVAHENHYIFTTVDKFQGTPEATRGRFSISEMALQNLFELMSFTSTIVFPQTQQFRYPIFISYGAIILSAACFAGYVRHERGHLLHTSKCVKGRGKYHHVAQREPDESRNDA